MPYRVSHAFLLAATLAAAGCTTVSVAERTAACRATDWASYGQNDGVLGVATAERAEKFTDCAELGQPADIAAYQAGRTEGLVQYCTVENGYEVGRAGRKYRKVCPVEQEQAFLQGYEQGRKERPRTYSPYVGFGVGVGHYPHFGLHLGHHFYRSHHHRHYRHRRGHRHRR